MLAISSACACTNQLPLVYVGVRRRAKRPCANSRVLCADCVGSPIRVRLNVEVGPAVAGDADTDARVVGPLEALHVEPERAAVEAADHRLGVSGRREPLDEAGREVGVGPGRRRRRRLLAGRRDVGLRHRRWRRRERIGLGRDGARRQRRADDGDRDRDEGRKAEGGIGAQRYACTHRRDRHSCRGEGQVRAANRTRRKYTETTGPGQLYARRSVTFRTNTGRGGAR